MFNDNEGNLFDDVHNEYLYRNEVLELAYKVSEKDQHITLKYHDPHKKGKFTITAMGIIEGNI